ncbi:MAG TPA: type II toxin-antitoxin system VapC family toxin [Mycobacteriales bacterium]|jgi:hypothetical protein|nr:type II toxin-antitoxin system VapC family toxin [Mycobacteriales bacterium]
MIRAYFPDEADHDQLRRLLREGKAPIVTSELTRLEFTSAAASAYLAHRIPDPHAVLNQFESDCGEGALITLLRLEPRTILPLAQRLVTQYPLRTMDAVHLAVSLTDAVALTDGGEITVATRDKRQAEAARACGLAVI